jgi:hypothetical protein
VGIIAFFALVFELSRKIFLLGITGREKKEITAGFFPQPIPGPIFICSIDDQQFPKWLSEELNLSVDFFHETNCLENPSLEFDHKAILKMKNLRIWIVSNIDCLASQDTILEKLPSIISHCTLNNLKLMVTSGISWKYLMKSLGNESKEIAYSQLFSGFEMKYVPIDGTSIRKEEEIKDTEPAAAEYVRSKKPYFFNIWEKMSLEEKKVCYDFSTNGFFNPTNVSLISELIQKGILIRKRPQEELPELFSRSFRQFIEKSVSETEKEYFSQIEKRKGNAGNIQIAVFSFLLLAVALISYYDKTFLDQASTIVTGIVGALGGLYSLIGKALSNANLGKKVTG